MNVAYNKEHLSAVSMWQQEEAQDCCVGNLVIERLSVKLEKRGINLDVVATPETPSTQR